MSRRQFTRRCHGDEKEREGVITPERSADSNAADDTRFIIRRIEETKEYAKKIPL